MAPALRMTHANKECYKFFCHFEVSLFDFCSITVWQYMYVLHTRVCVCVKLVMLSTGLGLLCMARQGAQLVVLPVDLTTSLPPHPPHLAMIPTNDLNSRCVSDLQRAFHGLYLPEKPGTSSFSQDAYKKCLATEPPTDRKR